MPPEDSTRRDPWAILFSYLLELRSDDVVKAVSQAGLNVDWNLNEREAYSHLTRIRAYTPRIQTAYNALGPEAKASAFAVLAAEVVRLHPRSDDLQVGIAAADMPDSAQPGSVHGPSNFELPSTTDARKVFVVHGRDTGLKIGLFDFLRALGLEPIDWSEAIRLTGRASPYIGEILDVAFGHAQAIVVLLSPEDEVRLAPDLQGSDEAQDERQFMMQPRPNVIFEAGMGFGRNPDRTILVEVGNVKAFSDIAGRHVVRLSNDESRRRDLADRLTTAGCAVNFGGDAWRRAGNFAVARAARVEPAVPYISGTSRPGPLSVKWVDLNYPHDSGLQAILETDGYVVRWSSDSRLARRLDIEGWSLVTQEVEEGRSVVFKVRDRPEDQTLIKKKNIFEERGLTAAELDGRRNET